MELEKLVHAGMNKQTSFQVGEENTAINEQRFLQRAAAK